MKYIVKIAATLFSLALMAAMAAGAYYVLKLVTNLYAKLDVQIAPIVAFASLVLLLSALVIAGGIREARKRAREHQLVRDKAVLYERIIHELVDAHGRRTGMTDLGESLQDLERSLALRAGPAVLKTYAVLKTLQKNPIAASPEIQAQLATVLFEMRKDLGLSNQGLKNEELPGITAMRSEVRSSQAEMAAGESVAISV